MSRTHFAPILDPIRGIWRIGKIVDHEAQPLTKDEMEKACDLLNLARTRGRSMDQAIAAMRALGSPSPPLASNPTPNNMG